MGGEGTSIIGPGVFVELCFKGNKRSGYYRETEVKSGTMVVLRRSSKNADVL